jgi:hypothetical protein
MAFIFQLIKKRVFLGSLGLWGLGWLLGVADLRCDTSEAAGIIPFLFLIISLIHFADTQTAGPAEQKEQLDWWSSFPFLA